MQGRPQGVHFTLADMFLRNKAERLTNTALPVFREANGLPTFRDVDCFHKALTTGIITDELFLRYIPKNFISNRGGMLRSF